MRHLDSLPTGFVEIGGAMAAVAVLGLAALLSGISRFDGVLLWALGGTTGAWLVVDHEHEIAILWSLSSNHGLTVADLAAVPSVLVAVTLGLRSFRAPRPAVTISNAPADRSSRYHCAATSTSASARGASRMSSQSRSSLRSSGS